MSDTGRVELLERYGRIYGALGLAITFTKVIDPTKGDPKKVLESWDKTKPLQSAVQGERMMGTGVTRNPVVVLRPSGLVGIENDTREGLARIEALALPKTVTVQSSEPWNRHWWFRPPNGRVPQYVAFRFEEAGVSADTGRYFLVPPALHPSGVLYEFLASPEDVEIAVLPEDRYEELVRQYKETESGEQEQLQVDPDAKILPGRRRKAIFRYACQQRRWTSNEEEIAQLALIWNRNHCDPPLSEEQVRYQVKGAMKKDGGQEIATVNSLPAEPAAHKRQTPTYTDLGNAERFAEANAHRLQYVKERGQWLHWREGRWRVDETGEAVRAAKGIAREMLKTATAIENDKRREDAVKYALSVHSDSRIRAMLSLATTEPEIVLAADELDRDPFLLSCANGTLDLRTGDLRASNPADLISLGSDIPYESEAACPRWKRFLREVFAEDDDLVAYMQRLAGYALTGDTREQIVAVLHGSGGNGKDTFIKRVMRLLGTGEFGGMAKTTPMETFARVRDRGVRNDLARLHRARLVIASESAEGRRLDETTIKSVSGGNAIAARFLYGEFFEYVPGFKVWLVSNHRPKVEGDDDAIWRRLRLIPFNISFIGREDKELDAKLDDELPGILSWAVTGCLSWQANGLGSAPAVENATREYRLDEDVLGAFIEQRCVLAAGAEVEPAALRVAYADFCEDAGEKPATASVLGRRLARRGITRAMRAGRSVYVGVRLKR